MKSNELENTENNFCFKYSKNDSTIILKAIITFLLSIFLLFGIYDNLISDDLTGIIVFFLMFLISTWGLYSQLHRLLSYDEICVSNGYFIVKNKNKIISETLIEEINCTSFVSIIAIWNNAYIKMYVDKKLIFHYKEREYEKVENDKLQKIFKEHTKATR